MIIYRTFSFFLAAEDPVQGAKDHKQVISALANSAESVEKIEKFFFDNTRELIQTSSYSPVVGKVHIVDIVRDVLKYVPVRWAATEIVGFIHNYNKGLYGLLTFFFCRLVSRSRPRRIQVARTPSRNYIVF